MLQAQDITVRQYLFRDGLHVFTYLTELDRLYSKEYLDFEPDTFRSDLGVSNETLARIMAGVALKTTSRFWNNIVVFEKIALALNNRSVSFAEYQELSPGEVAWAVTEAGLITDPEPLDDDIQIYIAKRLYDEGYDLPPFPLGEVQDELNAINKTNDYSISNENRQMIQGAKHDAVNDYIMQQTVSLLEESNID